MRASSTLSFVLSSTIAMSCATRYLPPPAAPERVAPQAVAEAPPAHEGEGTVTLDVAGERARVERVTSRTQYVNPGAGMTFGRRGSALTPTMQYTLQPLCETPCAVNLPLGPNELLFSSLDPSSSRSSAAFVQVSPRPSVVRHALGSQTSHVGGIIGAILMGGFGAAGVMAGGALLLVDQSSERHTDGLGTAGAITLGVGAALAAGAVALGLLSRPEEQPGATTQWSP